MAMKKIKKSLLNYGTIDVEIKRLAMDKMSWREQIHIYANRHNT